MKIKLNGNDLDSYNIRIPVHFLLGKQRQNYLYRELDKRHPCFSNRYAYDEKLKFTWKGIVSEITVIDKLILGSYRTKYPASSFTNENGKIIFSRNAKKLVFVIPLLLLLASVYGLFRLYRPGKINNVKALSIEEKTEKVFTEKILIPGLYEDLLKETEAASGKLNSFSWSYDGYTERISLDITGCYPTDFCKLRKIEELSCSSVVMNNGEPCFSLEKNRKVLWEKEDLSEKPVSDFSEEVRRFLTESECEREGESYKPFTLRFRIRKLEKLFNKEKGNQFESFLENSGYVITGLKIHRNGNTEWRCEMTFLPGKDLPFSEGLLFVLSQKGSLFEKTADIKEVKKSIPPKKVTETDGKKIAVIKHSGNGENIYFKNEKGRIFHEKKN